MNLFQRAFSEKPKAKGVSRNRSSHMDAFKEIMTAIAVQITTASPHEARKALREEHGLGQVTSSVRFKEAMEIQKWLNEEHLIFRYNNDN